MTQIIDEVIDIYILRVLNNLLVFSLLLIFLPVRSQISLAFRIFRSERKEGMFSDIEDLMTASVTLTLIVASFPF